MNERENLTSEETADLNKLHCAAFDLVRQENRKAETIPPMWLCMSAEAKQEAVENLFKYLSKQTGRKIDLLAAHLMCGALPDDVLDGWQEAEAIAKKARTNGNPRGYFAH